MMRIHTRLVLRNFIGLFLLCFLGSVIVFVVIDFVGNSKVWINRPPEERTAYYLNYLPYIAFIIHPIALLLAAVFSVGNMAKHMELVALRAAGVSITRVLAPILIFGILLTGAAFWVQETILPTANHNRFQIQEPKREDSPTGDPKERYHYLYTGQKGYQVYFSHYSGRNNIGDGVTVLTLPEGKLAVRIDAPTMVWTDSGWILIKARERYFRGDAVTEKFSDTLALNGFRDKPSDILDSRIYPEEMTLGDLEHRIDLNMRNGEPLHVWNTQWHFRFASSMVGFFMLAIGAFLAVHAVRTGLALYFGYALLISFLYFVFLKLGLVFGEQGALSPLTAAWLGNLMFFPLLGILWWRATRV